MAHALDGVGVCISGQGDVCPRYGEGGRGVVGYPRQKTGGRDVGGLDGSHAGEAQAGGYSEVVHPSEYVGGRTECWLTRYAGCRRKESANDMVSRQINLSHLV